MNNNNYVAIMAGGIGSRFWPMSRRSYPKQFLDILNTGKTLLQGTYERFLTFIPIENIYIVTSTEYKAIVHEQLPDLPIDNIIAEPIRKNTAPCIALVSMKLLKKNPLANLVVAPSDHMINDIFGFKENCLMALRYSENTNTFLTLGIKPTYANTGYGYIQFEDIENDSEVFKVKRFTEKPNIETATGFYKDGGYFWNAGIFIWKAKDIMVAFEQFMPEMYQLFNKEYARFNTQNEEDAISEIYESCDSISIDYAILEKAKNVKVVPAKFDWSDLGTWNSAYENITKDEAGNALASPNALMVDANGCMVHSSDKKLIMIGGIDDLIVVNTADALLICKKENEQAIKEYVSKLKELKGEAYL